MKISIWQLYSDEASGGSEYLDATNHCLNESGGLKEDYSGSHALTMRDLPDDLAGTRATWEGQSGKHSNSGSEVSLACLQGRIQAM